MVLVTSEELIIDKKLSCKTTNASLKWIEWITARGAVVGFIRETVYVRQGSGSKPLNDLCIPDRSLPDQYQEQQNKTLISYQ